MSYKIGTRGSLLALTQCGQVKEQLEKISGKKFELVILKTQGDLNTSKPLWQLDGKDFFTKELDQALINGDVDLVVHSYKDLGSERPEGIELAAITKRDFPHDILLMSKETVKSLPEKKEVIVGTSSPRRIVNIENHLKDFIPVQSSTGVKTKMLRGNVNTRIEKLRSGEYDAIVLAMAGIERLAIGPDSTTSLEKLLDGLTFMVLPTSHFPSAASQGALAIEVFNKGPKEKELRKILDLVNDQKTIDEVKRERKAFASYGGGCHLAVGIQVLKKDNLYWHVERGVSNDKTVFKDFLECDRAKRRPGAIFMGLPIERSAPYPQDWIFDDLILKAPIEANIPSDENHFLITGPQTIDLAPKHEKAHLWAGGSKTMQKLASKGYWVHGSSEGMGEEELLRLTASKAIKILIGADLPWKVLTNTTSQSILGDTIGVYTRSIKESTILKEEDLKKCQTFYWTSFFQYQTYMKKYPFIEDKDHCCGVGKTFKAFNEHNIKVIPFAGISDFKKWTEN